MTSLTDVYERGVGDVTSRRRVLLGLLLFGAGAAMVVTAIVVATTGVGERFGLSVFEAREVAGILAGLGVPATFLGSFTVLPASRRTRAAAVIGGSLTVLGVALFREVYPVHWVGSPAATDFTFPVVVVYFVGAITTFWCLFVAVANLKTRNDPGGTVTMEVTEEGTRILEVTGSIPGMGGVGIFGTNPDGEVRTQTNKDEEVLYAREESRPGTDPAGAASDGGSATAQAGGETVEPEPDVDFVETAQTRGQPDPYCGNCAHFQYVRVDGEIEPACTLHSEVMDDMDACEQWQGNN